MENEKSFASVIEESGYLAYTIRGVSMRPLLRQGKDVVVIEKPNRHWGKYDTVLFLRRNGQYVLHRILKVMNGKCWIVGDNCISGEVIDDDQIIGVMTSIKRGGKTIKVTNWKYKMYVHLWCDAYPIRFFILRVKWSISKFIYRCIRFVKRRVFG